jgi:hypothetical protein
MALLVLDSVSFSLTLVLCASVDSFGLRCNEVGYLQVCKPRESFVLSDLTHYTGRSTVRTPIYRDASRSARLRLGSSRSLEPDHRG